MTFYAEQWGGKAAPLRLFVFIAQRFHQAGDGRNQSSQGGKDLREVFEDVGGHIAPVGKLVGRRFRRPQCNRASGRFVNSRSEATVDKLTSPVSMRT